MKELDLLLESFARRTLPGSPKHDWDTFERLLALPDPLLADYLLAGVVPQEAVLADLVTQVRRGLNFYSGLQSIPGGSAR